MQECDLVAIVKDICGIKLRAFADPVQHALAEYTWMSGERVRFDGDQAAQLEIVDGKPNAARSVSPVRVGRTVIGDLFVIAFRPGEGTGDESIYHLDKLVTGEYPRIPAVVPRAKTAARAEAHLTIATFLADEPDSCPIVYAGSFDLIGLRGNNLVKLADLGQPRDIFGKILRGEADAIPQTTLTVGQHNEVARREPGARFGDPHAVFAPSAETLGGAEVVQVCGFLAIGHEMTHHLKALDWLWANEPNLLANGAPPS
jgi:hypothetical protein